MWRAQTEWAPVVVGIGVGVGVVSIGVAAAVATGWRPRSTWRVCGEADTGTRDQRLPNNASVHGLEGLIGNTPLVEIKSLSRLTGCTILAKAEHLNPGGSSKDRVALGIIEEAERSGALGPGGTIVEGTAGSTGISLALLARARGYKCSIYMPDDMATEKSDTLRLLGAEVVRLPAVSIVNSEHYCKVAERVAAELENGCFANQFENTANFLAHYRTTGPEIWRQTGGKLSAFVMAAGTGGTIAGVGAYLREQDPGIKVFLIDPPGSALFHKVESGVCYAPQQAERRLQRNRYDTITEGIGIDRLTANFELGLPHIGKAYQGTDQEAVHMAHFLLQHDGLFIGSSSAMNCVGAVKVARDLGPGHTIVTMLCDSGTRATSKVFNQEFLAARNMTATPPSDNLDFVS
eukprot:m.53000 g.53000  ORF g.53000 m.53000 type:complete len:405 (+) comp16607_c1_seq1:241-1455(+)